MERKILLSIAFFLFAITLCGQDTIYFSDKEPKYKYQVIEYDPDNNNKVTATTYFKSGKVSSQFHYLRHSEDKTQKELIASKEFERINGELDGQRLTYWENGNSKRIEEYKNGELITGKCFNIDGEEIAYFDYHTQPEFPGGTEKLYLYLSKEIKYPKYSRRNKIEGTVVVSFCIDTDGSVFDVKIVQSVSEDIDNESIRVIKNMPKWIPGKIDGDPIRTFSAIPLNFRL
jgi:protein TonB